jgi:Apea-like HEPN
MSSSASFQKMKPVEPKIIGKVIALTKYIYLRKPEHEPSFSANFLAGKRPFQPFSLEWWVTQKSRTLCEEISDMAISFDISLQGGDKESFRKTIHKTLQENLTNSNIFDINRLFSQVGTLFDARANNSSEQEFATDLWHQIHNDLVNSLEQWLILYPLRQIVSSSFELNFDGISVLSSGDKVRWQEYAQAYLVGGWEPFRGSDESGWSMNDFIGVPTWLLCEVSGTALGARQLAQLRMRTFIAILFSTLDETEPGLLNKSGAKMASQSIQFPSSGKCGCETASIGKLVPPLLNYPVNVSEDALLKVADWYKQRSQTHEKSRQRANIASHFLHYGIMDDELDRFIHFFIVLDSLFGDRNQVEKNIKEGLRHTFASDLTWKQRAKELFELRNSLIHGGVSRIRDWKRLKHYRRHFRSDPMNDVQAAAMIGLKNYFTLKTFEHLFLKIIVSPQNLAGSSEIMVMTFSYQRSRQAVSLGSY